MRLDILNRGYGPGTKLLFALIRVFSGHPAPDAAKLVFYRPGFYGNRAKKFTHEAMRGPSAWSVADRELMAAFVSKVNECAFCVGAHTATAGQAYQDGAKVQAVLADLESAPVEDGLRATLRMLGKLTREGKVGAEDMREVLSAGVSRQQVEDALAVCAAFNTTDRLADAFGFELLSPRASRQEPSTCSSGVTDSTAAPVGTIEELIFRDGVSRKGSAMLVESWTITDEPEPMEIAREASASASRSLAAGTARAGLGTRSARFVILWAMSEILR